MNEPKLPIILNIKKLLAAQGLIVTARPLKNSTQESYLLEIDTNKSAGRNQKNIPYCYKFLVLKIYKSISHSRILAIQSALLAIGSANDIQTPKIFAVGSTSPDEGEEPPWLQIESCQPFVIYTFVAGQTISDQINVPTVCRIAKAVSSFHAATTTAASYLEALPHIDLNTILSSCVSGSFALGTLDLLPSNFSNPVKSVTDFVSQHVNELDLSFQTIVHGDMHLGNLLNGTGFIGIIDVAGMAVSSPALDFMALVASLSHLKLARKLMDAFFESYSLDGFNTAYTQPQILALVLLRRLMLLSWVVQRAGDVGESLPEIAVLYAKIYKHIEQDIACFGIDFGYFSYC